MLSAGNKMAILCTRERFLFYIIWWIFVMQMATEEVQRPQGQGSYPRRWVSTTVRDIRSYYREPSRLWITGSHCRPTGTGEGEITQQLCAQHTAKWSRRYPSLSHDEQFFPSLRACWWRKIQQIGVSGNRSSEPRNAVGMYSICGFSGKLSPPGHPVNGVLEAGMVVVAQQFRYLVRQILGEFSSFHCCSFILGIVNELLG